MGLLKEFKADQLSVRIYATRCQMGQAAAVDVAARIRQLLRQQAEINMIFAAAPSQDEFLAALAQAPDIDWGRINAFHMDEYIGLAGDSPQGFGNFLRSRLFALRPFHSVNYINGNNPDIASECARYARLLQEHPIDIVCLGIGENGHIAFNDPYIARFDDPDLVKAVQLDPLCRSQQVHDGCFPQLAAVPTHALTLTIPALTAATFLYCIVPAATKEQAVTATVRGPVAEACPASILRTHPNARLYTDRESGRHLIFRQSVITDEISQDLAEAAEVAARFGLEAVEIRSVWNKGPHELSADDIGQIRTILARHQLRVSAISAPLFKCDLDNAAECLEQYAMLQRCINLARSLDTKLIRGFTFWAQADYPANLSRIAAQIKAAEPALRAADMTLVLEMDPSVNAGNATKLVQVLSAVNSPQVRALWDPGNAIFDPTAEIPYPDGYRLVRPFLAHVHIKDATTDPMGNALAVPVGQGQVDYVGQLKALLQDGYDGYIALETHYRMQQVIGDDLMKLPKGAAFSQGGRPATEESLGLLQALIERVICEMR